MSLVPSETPAAKGNRTGRTAGSKAVAAGLMIPFHYRGSSYPTQQEIPRYPFPTTDVLAPPAELEEMRRKCPVAIVELPRGDEATLLTRHAHVKQRLSDPRFARPTIEYDAARLTDDAAAGTAVTGRARSAATKGESHRLWRRQVSKWFTAKRMTALRPFMIETAGQLVDDMVKDGAPADLRARLGFPLPVYVICDMLGVPAADRERFSHWSDAFLSLTRFSKAEVERTQREFTAYMSDHIARKRAEPSDLTSASRGSARQSGDRLGGRHLDIGQGLQEPHVVLADPDGNEFCAYPPTVAPR